MDTRPGKMGIPRKILIVKPSALGDIVHSLPFLHAVKSRFPGAEVHWVVANGLDELLEDHPLVEKLWVIHKEEWKQIAKVKETARALRRLFTQLRRERYDAAIDLQGLFRSGMISWFTAATFRIGFQEAREGSRWFYTHRVVGGAEVHAVERYLKIAAFMGCDTREKVFPFPPVAEDSPVVQGLPPFYAVMAPAAGKEANRWPAPRFGSLAAKLPFPSMVVAGRADETIARTVVEASNGRAVSLAGKTSLKELIAVIRGARFLVSNDTGPMHIAAALNIPVFAIFGPANPLRTGPYGSIHTVVQAQVPCAPCYRWKKCHDWKCLEAIRVDDVLDVIQRQMGVTEVA